MRANNREVWTLEAFSLSSHRSSIVFLHGEKQKVSPFTRWRGGFYNLCCVKLSDLCEPEYKSHFCNQTHLFTTLYYVNLNLLKRKASLKGQGLVTFLC